MICAGCQADIPRIESPRCYICGLPRSGPCVCGTGEAKIWALDGVRSIFRFEGVAREAVHSLKYKNVRIIAKPLAQHLANYLIEEPWKLDLLVPVPLHKKRLRQRGYNQSGLLVQHLEELTGIPSSLNCLYKNRDTKPQARTTNIEERRLNVVNAFTSVPGLMKGKNILLIDDVITTGATLEACALELKRGGATAVWGLTLARGM